LGPGRGAARLTDMHTWWEWLIAVVFIVGLSVWITSAIIRFINLIADRCRKP